MHPEDLMKPDLLSEILLLVSGGVMFTALLLFLTKLARASRQMRSPLHAIPRVGIQ